MSAFDIRVTSLAGTTYQLGPQMERVQFSTQHPGGCKEFSACIPAQPSEVFAPPPYIGYNYRLDVIVAGEYKWSGRTGYPRFIKDGNGHRWEIPAKGYGVSLSDQVDTALNMRNTQTSDALVTILAALAPDIEATSITPSGFTISNATDVNMERVTPATYAMWMLRFGINGSPAVVYVYPDPNGTIRLTAAARPTSADVMCPFAYAQSGEIGGEESEFADKVTIQYGGSTPTSFTSVEDTAIEAQLGLVKEYLVVLPEITQSADATQAATVILEARKQLRLSASGPIVYGLDAPFQTERGVGVEPHDIRAGQMFRFSDVAPFQSNLSNLGYFNSFLIAETHYDEDARALTVIPESFVQLLQRSVSAVYMHLTGRHQVPAA